MASGNPFRPSTQAIKISLGRITLQINKVLLYVEQNHNFGEIRPRSFGWQLALQSIKSRQNELDLKKIIIIAGPNGAGKTTFARDFLPAEAQTLRFINADLIAAGLAPFNPESASIKAGRLMLEEIDECVDAGHSFAFETTLSGLAYLKKIAVCKPMAIKSSCGSCHYPMKKLLYHELHVVFCKVVTTLLKTLFAGASRQAWLTFMSVTARQLTHGRFMTVLA